MKIAINTIIDEQNYGNRLQNYALQTMLTQMGHQVVTIDRRSFSKTISRKEKWLNYFKTGEIYYKLKIVARNLLKKMVRKLTPGSKKKQPTKVNKMSLTSFTETYIHMTPKVEKNIWNWVNHHCDLVVIGSDQVWNCTFWDGAVIEFALPANIRKISYAASIGLEKIPFSLKGVYKKGLNTLSAISVREDSGKSIVETLTNKHADVVLDPTLLVTKAEWAKLIEPVNLKADHFLLTYFLSTPTQQTKTAIQKFAQQHHLTVLPVFDNGKLQFSLGQLLFLINNAKYLCTDSFHVSAFSIIFNKPFKTFARNNPDMPAMGSRLKTLFSILKITNNSVSIDDLKHYRTINQLLETKRVESKNILKKMIAEK